MACMAPFTSTDFPGCEQPITLSHPAGGAGGWLMILDDQPITEEERTLSGSIDPTEDAGAPAEEDQIGQVTLQLVLGKITGFQKSTPEAAPAAAPTDAAGAGEAPAPFNFLLKFDVLGKELTTTPMPATPDAEVPLQQDFSVTVPRNTALRNLLQFEGIEFQVLKLPEGYEADSEAPPEAAVEGAPAVERPEPTVLAKIKATFMPLVEGQAASEQEFSTKVTPPPSAVGGRRRSMEKKGKSEAKAYTITLNVRAMVEDAVVEAAPAPAAAE